MSEINTNPQVQNNNSAEPAKPKEPIPIWVGILILLALAGGFVYFFWKSQSTVSKNTEPAVQNNVASNPAPAVSNTPNTESAEPVPPVDNTAPAAPAVGSASINIDTELKKIDDSANSVNENDFDSNNFSNAEIGL